MVYLELQPLGRNTRAESVVSSAARFFCLTREAIGDADTDGGSAFTTSFGAVARAPLLTRDALGDADGGRSLLAGAVTRAFLLMRDAIGDAGGGGSLLTGVCFCCLICPPLLHAVWH